MSGGPVRVVLLRHGQSKWNAAGVPTGIPLVYELGPDNRGTAAWPRPCSVRSASTVHHAVIMRAKAGTYA